MPAESDHQAELEQAERHIREGEAHIERQLEIVAELERDGHALACAKARSLLNVFQETQKSHVDHRAMILREINGEVGPWNQPLEDAHSNTPLNVPLK